MCVLANTTSRTGLAPVNNLERYLNAQNSQNRLLFAQGQLLVNQKVRAAANA